MSELMERDLVCIVCPIGCRLKVTGPPDDLAVTGQLCKKGIGYAYDEINNPTRMVCTTAKITGGIHPVVPVKTDRPIPEKYKFDVVKAVNELVLRSPVKMGDVVLSGLFGTEVNIVAQRDM